MTADEIEKAGVPLNYYPITSAISIRDGSKMFTVMTDHTQGGTSPSSGLIEIMLNRRIDRDDHRGMGEPLNEMDPATGMPIRVPTTFYLNINDESVEASKQRVAQQKIDLPPKYFFSSFVQRTSNIAFNPYQDLAPLGINGTVKMQLTPIARNQI